MKNPLTVHSNHADGKISPREGAWPKFKQDAIFLARRATRIDFLLPLLAIIIYAFTRLYRLADYPIFFVGDEAREIVVARDLMTHKFRDSSGFAFPMFFSSFGIYIPMITVYFHALTSTLFGTSIEITRATHSIITLSGAIAAGLLLKNYFKFKFWWMAILALATAPALFLHSRTAFETAVMASFYIWFLYFYLAYRYQSPFNIFSAVIFAFLTFYSYGPGGVMIVATTALLGLSDIKYHLGKWKFIVLAALLGGIFTIPYFHWRDLFPNTLSEEFTRVGSYLIKDISLGEKAAYFAKQYLNAISPSYWFNPNVNELARHLMKGYGHLIPASLPFLITGLLVCVFRFRQSRYRALLICLATTPLTAALSALSITRIMAFPAIACIVMAVGIEFILRLIPHLSAQKALSSLATIGLCALSLYMLNDSLTNGPLWIRDYGLYGAQWGTKQVFEEIKSLKAEGVQGNFFISPNWINGPDAFIQFYSQEITSAKITAITDYTFQKASLDPQNIFILPESEVNFALSTHLFKPPVVFAKIAYPDGSPGFQFARFEYVSNADDIFNQITQARKSLVTNTLSSDNIMFSLAHSQWDGNASELFDNNPVSFVRGIEANPLVLDFTFNKPEPIKGITITLATMDANMTAYIYAPDATQAITSTLNWVNNGTEPILGWIFANAPDGVSRMRLEIKIPYASEPVKIHVREIKFRR